jgi:hypothetical protein
MINRIISYLKHKVYTPKPPRYYKPRWEVWEVIGIINKNMAAGRLQYTWS